MGPEDGRARLRGDARGVEGAGEPRRLHSDARARPLVGALAHAPVLERIAVTALTPSVAIVGRPNVGKSTLFNRLVGRRQAIVNDRPGVTRDRIVARSELAPGRPVEWVDTGGLVPGDDPLGLNEQVMLAVEACDLALLVVDGVEGLTTADERVLAALRSRRKPMVLVVNKADVRRAADGVGEFWALGLGEPAAVSAEHGLGIGALIERVEAELPALEAPPEPAPGGVAVAIVGRPNVGKSSLLNRLVGEPRTLVSPVAGTTRDPIDTLVSRDDRRYLLIDTAGIRRRSKVSEAPEELAVLLARRQIERAEIAILVIEAPAGVTSGDLAVAGAIWEAGRAAVVAINKWDLLEEEGRERIEQTWLRLAEVLAGPPRVNLSALTGRGAERVFAAVDEARRGYRLEIPTGELNRAFEGWLRQHQPPVVEERPWKLFYASQVATGPPTFMLFANRALPISHSYRRYLENRLRESFGLGGVPVRLVIRRRST
ncbi:MAG: ribosome biogenesis GTPase Der [Thermoanaerobaculia bacterium]|nr:MAG: ribosome biogenesis GTPase Der [Thermoanaerobaculia bacterium]